MRVALNAISFKPGTIGGMETSFRNLITAFTMLPGDMCCQLLGDSRYLAGLMPDDIRFELLPCNGFAPRSPGWLARYRLYKLSPSTSAKAWLIRFEKQATA